MMPYVAEYEFSTHSPMRIVQKSPDLRKNLTGTSFISSVRYRHVNSDVSRIVDIVAVLSKDLLIEFMDSAKSSGDYHETC
jgi:hypothetical protein